MISQASACVCYCSPWYGEERPKWLGPIQYSYPSYLRGGAPGDYAYDPLQLAEDSAAFDKYFEYELLHARWAMLGALGAIIPGAKLLDQ